MQIVKKQKISTFQLSKKYLKLQIIKISNFQIPKKALTLQIVKISKKTLK